MINPQSQNDLRIAVSGHRFLDNPEGVTRCVDQLIQQIAVDYPGLVWSVFSPLAEGADQLVVERILRHQPQARLVVPLPMPEEAYLATFNTKSGRAQFHRLHALAQQTLVLPGTATPETAFLQIGRYLIEQCDLLIAVWDGKPARGPGGTSDVVQMARQHQFPLAWINAQKACASPVIFENFERIKASSTRN